jgi:DNA-binding NtrC family response regulator
MTHPDTAAQALRTPTPGPEDDDNHPLLSILLIDRDQTFRETARRVLEHHGHRASAAGELGAAERRLHEGLDLLFVDEGMGRETCLDFLASVHRDHGDTLCVMMTAEATMGGAQRAMRAGAWDYVAKPFPARQVVAIVGRACHALERRRILSPGPDSDAVRLNCGAAIVGASLPLRGALQRALAVARTDAAVMLLGESGTGKDMFARLIHERSPRTGNAFVPLNCAAFPSDLLESEMFGHEKGAFTGAVRHKEGLVEVADEGTLFLDELCEMPVALQAKLLRVVQDGVVRRVGSVESGRSADVRFVAATNRDPARAIAEGRLREDLYYRLSVVPIELPPLRDRPEDIGPLARHFLDRAWSRHRRADGPCPDLSREALEALLDWTWPGNVRELRNVIEQAVVFARAGHPIGPELLPESRFPAGARMETGEDGTMEVSYEGPYHEAKEAVVDRFERGYLSRIMARAGGNVSEAARAACVDRTTLYRLMDKHGLDRTSLRP